MTALEQIGRDWGWRIERRENLARLTAAMERGESIVVYQDVGRSDWCDSFDSPVNFQRVQTWPPQGDWAGALVISDLLLPGLDPCPTVVYRPPTLVLGIGCRSGTPAADVEAMFQDVCREHGFAPLSVGLIATAATKVGEPGLIEFAARQGIPLRGFSLEELASVPNLPTPSLKVKEKLGIRGVAEPAALLGTGYGRLVMFKQQLERITMALARREDA